MHRSRNIPLCSWKPENQLIFTQSIVPCGRFFGSVLPQLGIQPKHFTEGLGIHWDGQWDGKWPTNIDVSPHGLCFTIIPTLWFSMTVCVKMRFYCKPLDVGIQTNHDKPIWLFEKPVLTNCTIGISDVFKYAYITYQILFLNVKQHILHLTFKIYQKLHVYR